MNGSWRLIDWRSSTLWMLLMSISFFGFVNIVFTVSIFMSLDIGLSALLLALLVVQGWLRGANDFMMMIGRW